LPTEGAASFVAREVGPVGFRRDVVLKLVAEGDPVQAQAAHDLAEEATLGSRLNHPNIVRTHDFFAREGRVVLVVERVDGITLAELLASLRMRQERLSDPAALYVGVAVLEALAHAHAQVDAGGARAPIVHGRLEAARIALGKDGSVKVGGFSTQAPREPALVAGEPSFPAPSSATLDGEKADVRAAGLLLWEMLTGREASAGVEPLSSVRSDLPRELSAAVGAALDVANAKRAVGCAEVASWIKKVARVAEGRDELRARVTALAPPAEPDPADPEANGDSARIPMTGWSVRLAPITSKVLSVRTEWPRLDAAVRRQLAALSASIAARWPKFDALVRRHQRASLAIATGVALLMLVTTVRSLSRSKADASNATATAGAVGARIVPAAPRPPVYSGPSVVGPAPSIADKVARSAAATRASAPAADKVETPAPPEDKVVFATPGVPAKGTPVPPKGFGFLTVHSSIGYAWVYVQLYRYGHVDRRLTVRCGKRFLSLGTPKPNGGEPTWFAPSRTVDIPCGGAVEVTMMPKWIP
jgi:serine/threonine-protein kinase